jgi:hypothetical protein
VQGVGLGDARLHEGTQPEALGVRQLPGEFGFTHAPNLAAILVE